MAYTRIWDDTIPTGTEAANTISQIFRNVKSDIDERLVDIFGMASMATDPLRPYVIKFSTVPANNDFLPGAASGFRFRDIANANTNLSIADNGNVVIRGTLTSGAITASLNGNVTGNVTGNVSGSAATVTAAAQPAITSLGTLTGLTTASLSIAGTTSTSTTINTSTGAVTDLNQIFFQRGGINKWRLGTNIDSANVDNFNLYNESGAFALTIAKATNAVTFAGALTVNSGLTVSAGGITVSSGNITITGSIALHGSSTNSQKILLGDASVFGMVGALYSGGNPVLVCNAYNNSGADLWNRSLGGGFNSYMLLLGENNNTALSIRRSPSGTADGTFTAYWTQSLLTLSDAGLLTISGGLTATSGAFSSPITVNGPISIIANANYFTGVTTGAVSKRLIGINGGNQIVIDPDGLGVIFAANVTNNSNITLGTNSAINNGTATVAVATNTVTTVGTIPTPSASSVYLVTVYTNTTPIASVGVGSMIAVYSAASNNWTNSPATINGNITTLGMANANIQVNQQSGSTQNVTVTWTKLG